MIGFFYGVFACCITIHVGGKHTMAKQSKPVVQRRYRAWTKATVQAYMSRVNFGELPMGLTYWSAADFLKRVS